MKIGKNIAEIRETKGYCQQDVANELGINLTEYQCIENDSCDITLSQLAEIANVLSCSSVYILKYNESTGSIYNYFNNYSGSKGINIRVQGIDPAEIRKAYKELHQMELERIPKFEKLLRDNNINFDF